jgi:predicted HTH transcriptional regulator
MTRRKFRNSPRREPSTQRSFQEFILNQPAPQTSRTELLRLIRGGEDTFLELKVKLSNSERIAQEIVAMANTSGGTMVFGVNDQLRIEGLDYPEEVQNEIVRICRDEIVPPLIPFIDVIAFDNGRRIVALDVEGKRRPYRTRDGKFFLRIGADKREATREELSMFLEEIRPLGYENIPVYDGSEADIDDALLWSFARAFEFDRDVSLSYNTAEFLRRELLLAVPNGETFIPTVAAILLFGKNERVEELIPNSGLTAIRFSGNSSNSAIVEKLEINGNLLTQFESALAFVKRYCDLWDEKPRAFSVGADAPVSARGNFHRGVISEAIANALIHRDLALREAPSRILIYDGVIEIINARRTNGFVPPASRAIRFGLTQRLNPQIAAIFSSPAYEANLVKSDLPKLLRDAKEFSGRRAEIFTSNDEFRLKIYSN